MELSKLTVVQKAQINKYKKHKSINTIDFDHYSKRNFGPWNPYWFVYNFVQQYFVHSEQKLLDFGCGAGINAIRYARMGYQVYGFDISDQHIKNAKILAEKYGLTDKVTFSVQVAEKLDYSSDFFDIIVGVNILHHINVEESIKEISRILKKDGCVIFKEPLQTPKRDRIRNSKIIGCLITKIIKDQSDEEEQEGENYEHMLNDTDFSIMYKYFSKLTINRWRILSILKELKLIKDSANSILERCDWLIFKLLPFMRNFGDQAVLILENKR